MARSPPAMYVARAPLQMQPNDWANIVDMGLPRALIIHINTAKCKIYSKIIKENETEIINTKSIIIKELKHKLYTLMLSETYHCQEFNFIRQIVADTVFH